MAVQIPSRFDMYQFTDEELYHAKSFTPLNLMYLRSLRTMNVELKLGIKLDVENPLDSVQQLAWLDAKINLLDELIGDSPVASMVIPKPEGE